MYEYADNTPIDELDPIGLDGQIFITRTSGTSATVVTVWQNGQYIGAYIGNAGVVQDSTVGNLSVGGNYYAGTRGPADGTYNLLPRTDYAPGDHFPNGTPAITGPGQPVGHPTDGYRAPVFFHLGFGPNQSTNCQTSSDPSTIQSIKNLMMNNLNNGGTKVIIRTDPPGVQPALPAAPFPYIPLNPPRP
jgi:hypothetical protein